MIGSRKFCRWCSSGRLPRLPRSIHSMLAEERTSSHYLGVARRIEYPDTQESPAGEVTNTLPRSRSNTRQLPALDSTLTEAVHITLARRQVKLPSAVAGLFRRPRSESRLTIINPVARWPRLTSRALGETTTAVSVGDVFTGIAPNLPSANSCDLDTACSGKRTTVRKTLSNIRGLGLPPTVLQADLGHSRRQHKISADVRTWTIRNNTTYEATTFHPALANPGFPRAWNTNFRSHVFTHRCLQGSGAQYNRTLVVALNIRGPAFATRRRGHDCRVIRTEPTLTTSKVACET